MRADPRSRYPERCLRGHPKTPHHCCPDCPMPAWISCPWRQKQPLCAAPKTCMGCPGCAAARTEPAGYLQGWVSGIVACTGNQSLSSLPRRGTPCAPSAGTWGLPHLMGIPFPSVSQFVWVRAGAGAQRSHPSCSSPGLCPETSAPAEPAPAVRPLLASPDLSFAL